MDDEAHVINRRGEREPINLGKVSDRNRDLCGPAFGDRLRGVDELALCQEVIQRIRSGITTREIDKISVDVCLGMSARHADYAALAARIQISNLQKSNPSPFAEVYYNQLKTHGANSRIAPGFVDLITRPSIREAIEARLDLRRDFINTGFSIGTLVRSYLLRDPATDQTIELPQHMYMRVALHIHCMQLSPDGEVIRDGRFVPSTRGGCVPIADSELLLLKLEEAFRTYDALSRKRISHATPTIINAGMTVPQIASCYQTEAPDDLCGLYDVLRDTALMSKTGGGVSVSLSKVRADGALIRTSGGKSSGIARYMRVLMESQEYANQGGVRPGAFAVYLACYHADVLTFLEMALVRGPRHDRGEGASKLKYALWISDRFMAALELELTEPDTWWYLFSPDEAPGLECVYDERGPNDPAGPGGRFSDLYDRYVAENRYRRRVRPSEIVAAACKAIGQRGYPYFLFKDAINRQSNLSNQDAGLVVKNSNLCAEVIIPCAFDEARPDERMYSVCNLAAINLHAFVVDDVSAPAGVRMDFEGIIDAAGMLACNLDNLIELNYTDVAACHRSNFFYRAVGIGEMGLADVFMRFGYSFGSAEALELDSGIHACIYFGAMRQSALLARSRGSFPAFGTSRAAQGMLQPDLSVAEGVLTPDWAAAAARYTAGALRPDMWLELRAMAREGLRNGYVTACMPTATSSNAAGVNECFEPFTTHLYLRRTLAGEFTMLNPHLVRQLDRLKQWTPQIAAELELSAGSVATWDGRDGRPALSPDMRHRFRTAREMDPLEIVSHAVARNPFVSQGQSMNLYRYEVVMRELLEVWLTAWRSGLKTGSYYIHTSPAGGAQNAAAADTVGARADKSVDAVCPLRAGRPQDPIDSCSACSV